MDIAESYKDKLFIVDDADARLREPEDLMSFLRASDGRFKLIPQGSRVHIDAIQIVEAGSQSHKVFAHAVAADTAEVFGWTSSSNLAGDFRNETVGKVTPEPGAGRFGRNAAWSDGEYLGQIDLIAIVDAHLEIEYLAASTIQAYAALVNAAASDGIAIMLNSGFRSYPEQKHLREGFERGLPGFNTAAKPGFSKHQSGIAFDLAVAGGDGNPTYEWLKRNGPTFGFVRTVSKEPWHWEFDAAKAQLALAAGTYKTPTVTA